MTSIPCWNLAHWPDMAKCLCFLPAVHPVKLVTLVKSSPSGTHVPHANLAAAVAEVVHECIHVAADIRCYTYFCSKALLIPAA